MLWSISYCTTLSAVTVLLYLAFHVFCVPGSILKDCFLLFSFKFKSSCNDVTQTQTESVTEVLQAQAECKYKFVHTELVQVWISSCAFEFEKKTPKQSLKIDPGKHKYWNVKYNKTITALHFVQYDVLWSTENQY